MSKKVLIAGYPKSGNTWLGYMLAYLLGAPYVDLHQPREKTTKIKSVLDLISGNLPHSSDYDLVAKTHSLPRGVRDLENYDKVICIIRDPRDVTVSYFFFRYHLLPVELEKPFFLPFSQWPPVRFLLWKHMVFKLGREWPFHTLTWKALDPCWVRYEDLLGNPEGEVRRVLQFLGVQAAPEILAAALRSFSFEEMSGGRKKGQEDTTHFYRKGIIGDYKNHFSRFDLALMNRLAGPEMRRLGYGPAGP